MRKPLTTLLIILFAGILMFWTANANLALLSRTYPDPKFDGFGLFCLEGGVVLWTILYKLQAEDGWHKAIALVMVFIDILFAMTGFFLEISHVSGSATFVGNIPNLAVIIALDVAFNIIMCFVMELVPEGKEVNLRPLASAVQNGFHKVTDRQRATLKNTAEAANTPEKSSQK